MHGTGGVPMGTMHGPEGPSVAAVHGPGEWVTMWTTYIRRDKKPIGGSIFDGLYSSALSKLVPPVITNKHQAYIT